MFIGPLQQEMERKLLASFEPARLEVVNESDMHKGPPNRESHFKVVLVGDAFEGMNRVKRHRAVNAVLADELAGGVHALSIFAWTVAQWEERGGTIPASPLCRGGE
ncbi:MAG: BolA family transcriptional regulator [Deltaproteobacteria bacterium]|nr:BolA family transcriptional regulator [Deltaproteobacteria bacterium]